MAALQVGTPIVPDPDRKGKVESGIGHTQKTPLKRMRFESLEEAQAYLDRWEERWADTRNDGATKRQVAAMFAEEKPHLRRFRLNRSATTNTENVSSIVNEHSHATACNAGINFRPPTAQNCGPLIGF